MKIATLGIKTQQLIAKCYDLGLVEEARLFWKVDAGLWNIYLELKRRDYQNADRHITGESRGYIWRSQGDGKVRLSHRANDDKEFSWNNPPTSGHPGEDFNCRCWAEPIGDSFYASQLLISEVMDNLRKWENDDFWAHYRNGDGRGVTLQEVGLLRDVIEHYSKPLGIYDKVSEQIIDEAFKVDLGSFGYNFGRSYPFGDNLDFFLGNSFFSLGDSTVQGVFKGDAIKQNGFVVINGIVTYTFSDKFRDPTSKVERLMEAEKISREEALRRLEGELDEYGIPYGIDDGWQTKFNATVKVDGN